MVVLRAAAVAGRAGCREQRAESREQSVPVEGRDSDSDRDRRLELMAAPRAMPAIPAGPKGSKTPAFCLMEWEIWSG